MRQSAASLDPLKQELDQLSSSSSGVTRRYYQRKVTNMAELRKLKLKAKLAEEVATKEVEFWHISYDYLLTRSQDLGVDMLRKYVNIESQRKLTRRERTNPLNWHKLGDSAEQSNDSLRQIKFEDPLLIARQKW